MPFILQAAASALAAVAPTAATAATAATASAPSFSFATAATNMAVNLALSAALSIFSPQVGTGGRVSDWTLDPDAPIPFAAGRIGVAGSVVYPETFGPEKMYYGFVTVLSGAGPIKSVQAFRGDDEDVTFDSDGKAITSQWEGEMWIQHRLGAQPDTALTTPVGLKDGAQLPNWTTAHKLSGKACYMLVLGENSKRTAYPTGEVKPLVTLEGLFGWDPRQDSTWPGGSGACRLDNPATWVWIDNPILWALKWSLGLWEGPTLKGAPAHGSSTDYQVGGIGAKLSGVDVAAFVDAANVAEANGWTVAAYPNTDDSKSQVLDAFLQAGGAVYAQRAGKISCIHRAAPRASIVTITAADTAGPLEIDTAASRINRINCLRPRFWSEEHRWQMTAIDEITSTDWQAEDGGKRTRGIDFPFVSDKDQTAQLAALQIANTREGIAGRIPLKPHLQKIKPGDAFVIDEEGFVLSGLKCLCLNTDYDPATGVHTVTFVSETDGKYAYAFDQTGSPPPPQELTPANAPVTPPGGTEWDFVTEALTEGLGTIPALVFNGDVDNPRAEQVVFEYRVVDTPERPWAGAGVEDPNVVRKEVTSVTTGTVYEGAVSYRIGNRISDRLVLGPVTAGEIIVVAPGARRPISRSIDYPISSGDTSITILTHTVYFDDGSSQVIPAGSVTGLASSTMYGLFWRADASFEVEAAPAGSHMTAGRWIFLDWWTTSTGGVFPDLPPPPGGYRGGGQIPQQQTTT